jgi:hypothetical protein
MARTTEEVLIESVVDVLRNKRAGVISSVTSLGADQYQLFVSDTFDLVSGHLINVGGNEARIVSVVENVSFTVLSTSDLSAETSWASLGPYFFYGNPVDINNERNSVSNQRKNYPAIILFEVKNIRKNRDKSDVIERTPTMRLYFMDMCDHKDKTISEIYTDVLNRMEELQEEFVNQLDITPGVYIQDESYRVEKFSKWAVRVIHNSRANSEVIFDNELTGVGIEIDVPMSNLLNRVCE